MCCLALVGARFIEPQSHLQLEIGDYFKCMTPFPNLPVACPPGSNICMCPAGYFGETSRCEESNSWKGVCHPCKPGFWPNPNATTEEGCLQINCPENSHGFPDCKCDYGYTGRIDWLYCAGEWHGTCDSNGQGPLPPPVTTILNGPTGKIEVSSVQFIFQGSSEGCTFVCNMDGSLTDCFPPSISYEHLGQGVHVFSIRSKNELGQWENSPVDVDFEVAVPCPPNSALTDDYNCSCSAGFHSSLNADIPYHNGGYHATCEPCDTCPRGFELVDCSHSSPGRCMACPEGSFKETGVATSLWSTSCSLCQPCPLAHYRVKCGGNYSGECLPCAIGTFKTGDGEYNSVCDVCQACPAGFERHGCELGFEGVCHPCKTGTYKDATLEWNSSCQVCAGCEPGYTRVGCNATNAGSCIPCPVHSFKVEGVEHPKATCNKCEFCALGSGTFRTGCGGPKGPGSCGRCEECVGVAEDTCMCDVY